MNENDVEWYYNEGVAISEKTRDEWAVDCVKRVLADPDPGAYYSISSGDSMVVVFKTEDGQIEVIDAKVRREKEFTVEFAQANY
jgi:hypothetical protein